MELDSRRKSRISRNKVLFAQLDHIAINAARGRIKQSLFSHALWPAWFGIPLNVNKKTTQGTKRKYRVTNGEKPFLFTRIMVLNQPNRRNRRKSRFRFKSMPQTQAHAADSIERPVPILNVIKRPPQKAGPHSLRVGNTSEFGMDKYPASIMAVVVL